MQGYFLPSGMFLVIGHGLAGSLTREVLTFYACALPFILLAVFLGGKLNKAIPSARFERFIYAFLVLIGVYLFL
jgi:uncharacterized membrane protein YfcA